jgi:hypothetical protein
MRSFSNEGASYDLLVKMARMEGGGGGGKSEKLGLARFGELCFSPSAASECTE